MSSNDAGILSAITKDGRLVFATGYGIPNQTIKFKINPSHLFPIAGVYLNQH
jgi:hypothetical protein